jgi:hypothetical protein
MKKQREKSLRLKEAVTAQKRYFSGKAGSAKNLAHGMLYTLAEFARIPQPVSDRLKAELLELSRQDMIKELASCESALFQQITSIATALGNRDSKFFRDILRLVSTNSLPLDLTHCRWRRLRRCNFSTGHS